MNQNNQPVSGVVMRDGVPTLVRNKDIKPSDVRLYAAPQPLARVPLTDEQVYAEFSDWFQSIPIERKKILSDDKWMLAFAAFKAAHGITKQ